MLLYLGRNVAEQCNPNPGLLWPQAGEAPAEALLEPGEGALMSDQAIASVDFVQTHAEMFRLGAVD
jgi:hypothetical protein